MVIDQKPSNTAREGKKKCIFHGFTSYDEMNNRFTVIEFVTDKTKALQVLIKYKQTHYIEGNILTVFQVCAKSVHHDLKGDCSCAWGRLITDKVQTNIDWRRSGVNDR